MTTPTQRAHRLADEFALSIVRSEDYCTSDPCEWLIPWDAHEDRTMCDAMEHLVYRRRATKVAYDSGILVTLETDE